MKMRLIILLMAFVSVVMAVDPDNYYPENNESVNISGSIDTGSASTIYSTVRPSSIDVEQNEYGEFHTFSYDENGTKVDADINGSKPSELLEFAKAVHPKADMGMISRIANENNLTHTLSRDPNDLTIESLYQKLDLNNTVITGYEKGAMLAQTIASLQTPINNYIKCFISRELSPAMECPLSDKTALFGGDIYSDLATKKKECDDYCKDYKQCFSVNQNISPIVQLSAVEGSIMNGRSASVTVHNITRVGYIELTFELDADLYNTMPDFNVTKENIGFRFDMTGHSVDGSSHKLFNATQVVMRDDKVIYRANVSGAFVGFDFVFYVPKLASEALASEHRWPVIVSSAKAVYEDSSYYYCDATQVVLPGEICRGERIQITTDSGIIKDLCRMYDASIEGPEPSTGAYYTQASCDRRCYSAQECSPTYTIPGSDIAVSSYQIRIGCVDASDNVRCTEQKCQEYFTDLNATIFEEYNFQNEDEKVPTLLNQAPTNFPRPNIYLSQELTSTGPDSTAFIESMKDVAYVEMVEHSRFTRGNKTLNEATDIQMNFNFLELAANQRKLEWLIKPSNVAFDGSARYKYVVMRLTHSLKPKDAVYTTSEETMTADGTRVFSDIAYAVMTSTGDFKVYKRDLERELMEEVTEMVQMPCESVSDDYRANSQNVDGNCYVPKPMAKWYVLESAKVIDKMYDTANNAWLNYDTSMPAPSFDAVPFQRGEPIKTFTVSNDLYADIDLMSGGYVHYQTQPNGTYERTYHGTFDNAERSNLRRIEMYGFYSDTPLSYAQLQGRIGEDTIFFDNINQNLYRRPITGDAALNRDIELYFQGPIDDMNVISVIKPKEREYGKKTFIFSVIQ